MAGRIGPCSLVRALACLFAGATEQIVVYSEDWQRDDLSAAELVEALDALPIERIEWQLRLPDLALSCQVCSENAVSLRVPFAVAEQFTSLACFQSDVEIAGPLRFCAFSIREGNLGVNALHQLVGLAHSVGTIQLASATTSVIGLIGKWEPSTGESAVPLSKEGDIWRVSAGDPTLWFTGLGASSPVAPRPALVPAGLEADEALGALRGLLAGLHPASQSLSIVSLSDVVPAKFRATRAHDTVLVLSPTPTSVQAGIDLTQSADVLVDAALHALARVALGHIHPGDEHGHWDTVDTIRSHDPHRRWDAEVRSVFGNWFTSLRKVGQLEERTDLERAWLGLHRQAEVASLFEVKRTPRVVGAAGGDSDPK